MFEYIDIDQENIVIYIDMVILENIDIDMVILKNIDIEINIDIRENIAIDIYLYMNFFENSDIDIIPCQVSEFCQKLISIKYCINKDLAYRTGLPNQWTQYLFQVHILPVDASGSQGDCT